VNLAQLAPNDRRGEGNAGEACQSHVGHHGFLRGCRLPNLQHPERQATRWLKTYNARKSDREIWRTEASDEIIGQVIGR